MPLLRILPWATWFALALFSVATYSTLPELIPKHLDAAGNVTSTLPRAPWSWGLVPLVALVMLIALNWISSQLERRPQYFNFPEKERFLRIPHEYRGPVIERMREMLTITSSVMVLVFAAVQVMMWRTAMGHSAKGLSLALMVGVVMSTPALLVLVSRVNNAVDVAERRWKAAGHAQE